MQTLVSQRLILTPIRNTDLDDLEKGIFGDPEVVKGLVHDGSKSELRRKDAKIWCSYGPDGSERIWPDSNTCLYAIRDRLGEISNPEDFLGAAGIYPEKRNEKWTGELMYAICSPYHGKGVVTEACKTIISAFKENPAADSLFALYWHKTNPASGRVLEKLGFKWRGTHPFLSGWYDEGKAIGIRKFELWRLTNSPPKDIDRVIREVAIKLGHLEIEGISSKSENVRDILNAVPNRTQNGISKNIEKYLEIGRDSLGFGMMRLNL